MADWRDDPKTHHFVGFAYVFSNLAPELDMCVRCGFPPDDHTDEALPEDVRLRELGAPQLPGLETEAG